MRINFQGGAAEVGASCIILNIDGKNLLLDCGIRMGTGEVLPDMSIIQQKGGVDAILVSHAHMDHSGGLPVISREYPNAVIYMTHATKDLIRVLLYDSLRIMESREAEIPIFAEVHVRTMLERIVCFSPGFTFRPFDGNIKVTFYNAGHVAGSSGIYITGDEGAFFYSGDFSVTSQKTVTGASFPKLRPDVAILESTYGDRLHSDRDIEEQKLVEKVKEIISAGNKILIPAFALGRAQEVILILKKAINKGQLPDFKIYIDGMVKDICRVYKLNPNYLKSDLAKKIFRGIDIFYDDNIVAVTGRQEQREEIISKNEPCCIISSSGMLNGGPSQWYLEKLAPHEGNFIAITGYQDEESPGKHLLDLLDTEEGDRFLRLGERTVSVKCGVGKYGLSAHADKTQIISLAHTLGAKQLFFVHGNSDTVASLATEVQKEYRGKVYSPGNGDEYDFDIRNPRKQLTKQKLTTMSRNDKPMEEDIKDLWEFILQSDQKDRLFTAEELYYCYTGQENFTEDNILELQGYLNSSGLFEPDIRKPFLFMAIAPDIVEERKNKSRYMEVNQMLALADEYFSKESGLYKKGARFEEKVALLYFNFPDAAIEKYRDRIREFEEITGWTVEINRECNLMEAENLIQNLLPSDINISGSISYFRQNNLFKVKVDKSFDTESISKKFKEITRLNILFEESDGGSMKLVEPAKRQEGQMEQNKALEIINNSFRDKKDKLYKKSIKNENGEPVIELSFISPQVGNRYKNFLEELETRICWKIRINQSSNQNEIIKIGTRIFQEAGINITKNLSYMPKEMEVAAVADNISPEVAEKVKLDFEDATGLKICIKDSKGKVIY